MKVYHYLLAAILLCGVVSGAVAQESRPGFFKRLDNKLANHYFSSKYDTNYVERPNQRWLFRLMLNQTNNYIHAKGTVNDVYSKYDLHTRRNTAIALEVNYCDIAVSYSVNPDKIRGKYNDYEFNFEYHGNSLSFDINYQRATSLAGEMKLNNIDHMDEDALKMKVFNVAAYYTFSHSRFSFPAALYQNYYQLRSAGSWLAGASFQGGSIRTTDELRLRSPQAPDVHLRVAHLGIGGGYGYNLVLGKRSQWLLHLSALPTFVVYQHNKLSVRSAADREQGLDEHEVSSNLSSFNMIFNERAAVVYHFSPRYFIGTSLMMSNSVFDDDVITVNQNKWLARAFIGVRL